MTFDEAVPLIITWLSGSGFGVLVTNWSNRKISGRKGRAEARKLEAEAEKALSDGYKNLLEEYKTKERAHLKRIDELEELRPNKISLKAFQELIDREQEYHRELIKLTEENRDLKEQLLFIGKLKDHG